MGPLSALIKFSKEGPGHDEGRAQELDVPAYRDIVLALRSLSSQGSLFSHIGDGCFGSLRQQVQRLHEKSRAHPAKLGKRVKSEKVQRLFTIGLLTFPGQSAILTLALGGTEC